MADRSDEKRDDTRATGDILGLGGPTSTQSDIPDNTTPSPRRRRRSQDEPMTESSDMPHGHGATGIDMGSGGEGTDIE